MGVFGGHYGGHSTARKVLRAGLWWPTLHTDATDLHGLAMYVREMENHQGGMRCC